MLGSMHAVGAPPSFHGAQDGMEVEYRLARLLLLRLPHPRPASVGRLCWTPLSATRLCSRHGDQRNRRHASSNLADWSYRGGEMQDQVPGREPRAPDDIVAGKLNSNSDSDLDQVLVNSKHNENINQWHWKRGTGGREEVSSNLSWASGRSPDGRDGRNVFPGPGERRDPVDPCPGIIQRYLHRCYKLHVTWVYNRCVQPKCVYRACQVRW
jgi:hypothetical protein